MVARRPEGLDTLVGEGGVGLSAGERQRVALARAFLRDAPLLLLDEPTANLDGATEDEVLMAIRRLMGGRTVILVAHRPALVALADRVVDLSSGGGGGMSSTVAPRDGASSRARRTAAVDRGSLLGAGAIGAGIGLLATSAWLISRAAQHPHGVDALALGIVAVQFFGLSKGLLRYGQRLVRPRRRISRPGGPAGPGLRAARGAGTGRPPGVPQWRSDGAVRPRRRIAAGPARAGDLPVRDRDSGPGPWTVALVWLILPAAGADPAGRAAARRDRAAVADRPRSPGVARRGRPPRAAS